jgi:hypothetical protein
MSHVMNAASKTIAMSRKRIGITSATRGMMIGPPPIKPPEKKRERSTDVGRRPNDAPQYWASLYAIPLYEVGCSLREIGGSERVEEGAA